MTTCKEKLKDAIEFLKLLDILIRERGTEYQLEWKDVPTKIKSDFKSWVKTSKQQDWAYEDGDQKGWVKAWYIYQREYISFLINEKLAFLEKGRKQ